MCTSEPHTPHTRTRIRTSSRPTAGSGSSTTRKRGFFQTRLPLRARRRSASWGVGTKPFRGSQSASTIRLRIVYLPVYSVCAIASCIVEEPDKGREQACLHADTRHVLVRCSVVYRKGITNC